MATYSTSAAAKLLNIAPSSIRNYTANPLFRNHFSPTAAPERNKSRQLTDEDLQVLRFIAAQTAGGRSLTDAAAALDAGELKNWQPTDAGEPPQEAERALALVQATIGGLETVHAREIALYEQIAELRAQVATLQTQNAELHAKLDGRRSLWSRLFG